MPDTIPETVSALQAVEGTMQLPSATPGVVGAAAGAPPAAATDAEGTPFDNLKHELDPKTGQGRRTIRGAWIKKRGNGARKAQGKPLAGATRSNLVVPPSTDPPAPPSAPAGQESDPAAAPAAGTPPAGTITGVQVTTQPPLGAVQSVPIDDYQTTAEGLTAGTWAIFRWLGGEKWTADAEERSLWSRAWQRVWHRWQLPVIGPLAELIVVACGSIAKRDDGGIKRFFARLLRWSKGGTWDDPQPPASQAAP